VSIFIVVVLPAPFGPRNAKISPSFTLNETLSTALKPLNSFVRFFTSIAFAILPDRRSDI